MAKAQRHLGKARAGHGMDSRRGHVRPHLSRYDLGN